jgi:hypothetical protein
MTNKTFAVGGVSKTKGQYKVRFANDMTRVKVLSKTDTDINLVELSAPMTKSELVAFLKTSELYLKAEYKEAIDAADVKYNSAATIKVKGQVAAPSLDAIKARAAQKDVTTA